ncbi:MAG: NUDIX hydrolase [Candidatus Colwellbacteria bacterium]|nr:NUDIX hydrolase [Candidatus Colwellbacteria bacterium]
MEWKMHLRKLLGKKRHTAHVVLVRQGKLLLVQEAVGGIRGLWGLPGGGIKRKETAEKAVIREAKEEVGFDIELLKELAVIEDKRRANVRHVFLGQIKGGELKIDKAEHMDARWMSIAEIKSLGSKLRGNWVIEALDLV